MRMPRMTTRRWAAVVLCVGTVLGAVRLARQASAYRALATRFATRERDTLSRLAYHDRAISEHRTPMCSVQRREWIENPPQEHLQGPPY